MSRYYANNTNCCVPGCTSRKEKNPELSFHYFPPDDEKNSLRRKQWIHALKIGKPVNKHVKVCSKHFVMSDYFPSTSVPTKRYLKQGVIPNKCLPLSSVDKPDIVQKKKLASDSRKRRYEVINNKRQQCILNERIEQEAGACPCEDDRLPESEISAATAMIELANAIDHSIEVLKEVKDAEVQVCTNDVVPRIRFEGISEKSLNSLTGIHSIELFNVIVEYLNKIKCSTRQLTTKEQVILTMMCIKLNLAFVVLSALFSVSSTTSKNIFVDVVAKLAALFQAIIPWPSKEEVENNKPKVFKKFKDIRVVVDCTEIPVTKTKCLKCVISTYSQYYGEQTVKYMIGISPGGLATYISLGYGGRATDNAIFSQSSLINIMEPHIDKVMADKGFLIDEICTANFIEVVRPPFLKNGKFLPSECKCTKNIARARVHVERFIQRIKNFKFLHGKVPWNLLSSIDHIFTVVTGIANASNPIMSEKSF